VRDRMPMAKGPGCGCGEERVFAGTRRLPHGACQARAGRIECAGEARLARLARGSAVV